MTDDMPGAPSGQRALVQRETRKPFDVVVAPAGPYTDVDVMVRFKPMSGREDASAGIVFRFDEGHDYVIRANALEDNFRLYYYDRGRHQLARDISTARSSSTIGTRAIAWGASGCGRRRIP